MLLKAGSVLRLLHVSSIQKFKKLSALKPCWTWSC